jgi:hypothetical protein
VGPDALIEQGDVVGNVGIGGVFCPRFLQNSARMHEVAAQQEGIALIVEDLGRAADQRLRRGCLWGAVGEIEAPQPVIGGGEPEPGIGLARSGVDRPAEIWRSAGP